MSEMVERVAEAIAKKRDCYGLAECERDPCNCLRFARAAIEAMGGPCYGGYAWFARTWSAAAKEPYRPGREQPTALS
jgi:hypothetical protein